jgi:hypothetical protein
MPRPDCIGGGGAIGAGEGGGGEAQAVRINAGRSGKKSGNFNVLAPCIQICRRQPIFTPGRRVAAIFVADGRHRCN